MIFIILIDIIILLFLAFGLGMLVGTNIKDE
mgnify:CR=1 FL=1